MSALTTSPQFQGMTLALWLRGRFNIDIPDIRPAQTKWFSTMRLIAATLGLLFAPPPAPFNLRMGLGTNVGISRSAEDLLVFAGVSKRC